MDELDAAKARYEMLGMVNTYGKTEAEKMQLDMEYAEALDHYYACRSAYRETLAGHPKGRLPHPTR